MCSEDTLSVVHWGVLEEQFICKTWTKSVMYMLWRDVVEKDADKVGVHCSEFVCNLLHSAHG